VKEQLIKLVRISHHQRSIVYIGTGGLDKQLWLRDKRRCSSDERRKHHKSAYSDVNGHRERSFKKSRTLWVPDWIVRFGGYYYILL